MSGRLRVVHLLPDLARGGGQMIVRAMVAHPCADLEHHVVALGGGPLEGAFRAVAPLEILPVTAHHQLAVAARRVATHLQDLGADVVHTNNTPLDKVVGLAAAASRRCPVVNSLAAIATADDPRRSGEGARPFLARRGGNLVNRALAHAPRWAPAATTAVSEAVRASHARALHLPLGAIEVVRPGVAPAPRGDSARAAAVARARREELALGNAYPVLACVGRVEPNKGQLDLPEVVAAVAAALPEVVLLVVGDGPDLAELHRRVAAAGLGHHVRTLGEREDVADLLGLADLFVSTARMEGFGLAALEALQAGLPVVAFGGPHIALGEFVERGRNGALVDLGDTVAMAHAIVTLARSPTALAEASQHARASAVRHTVADQVERFASIYRRVVGAATAGVAR